MAGRKRKYVNNRDLLEEIAKSKKVQKKHPDWTPGECLTPKLVDMLMKLVTHYASRYNWRGYSYNDDMQSEALLSLSASALKFDETKSPNPFGYYTQIITRCFITYLDKEKKQRNIRDSMIEMTDTDMQPSYARQLETWDEEGRPKDEALDYAKAADNKKKAIEDAIKEKEKIEAEKEAERESKKEAASEK